MIQITLVGAVESKDGIQKKTTQNGIAYANFSLKVSRPGGKGHDYFRVTAWGKLADRAVEELRVGSITVVCGQYVNDRYQNEEGNWVDRWNVKAADFTVAGAAAAAATKPAAQPDEFDDF